MKNRVLIVLIFISPLFKAQLDTMKSSYGKLEVKRFYSVNTSTLTGPDGAVVYKAGDKVIDKATYEKYNSSSGNFKTCKPCVMETYDANEKLQNRAIKYLDCPVGYWINYYPSGKIKTIGYYRENESDKWEPLWDAGYCLKHGTWTDYDENGKITKTERYNFGSLKE